MAAPTQKGLALEIGIGSYTYDGYIVNSVEIGQTGEIKDITDENGAEVTNIISNLGRELTFEMIAKAASDPTLLRLGDVITINQVKYLVIANRVPRTKGGEEVLLNLTVKKKDSMSYT